MSESSRRQILRGVLAGAGALPATRVPATAAAPPAPADTAGSHWEHPPQQKVRVPEGQCVPGFAQITDLVPTILGRLNLKSPSRVTGEDLWPYVTGERRNNRDHAVSAFGYIASVRTKDWNYSAVWNREKYQGHYAPQLYDTHKDPKELTTVADRHPAVVKELQAKLEEYIASGWNLTNGSFNETAG